MKTINLLLFHQFLILSKFDPYVAIFSNIFNNSIALPLLLFKLNFSAAIVPLLKINDGCD